MQENINNNEQNDLNEFFRQKLTNHQLPVDDKCWSEIEARLNSKKKKVIPFWFWISCSSAVAVLCLLFTLQILDNRNPENYITLTPTIQKVNEIKETTADLSTVKQNTFVAKNQLYRKSVTTSRKTVTKNHVNTNVPKTDLKQKIETTTIIQTLEKDDNLYSKVESTNSTNSKDSTDLIINEVAINEPNEKHNSMKENKNILNEWTDPFDKKDHNNFVLTASISYSSGFPEGNSDLLFSNVNMESAIVKAPTYNTSIYTPSDFTNREYLPPLSFGLAVSKKINTNMSIESGLIYTYLLTNFKSTYNDAELNLHYMGLPLNLIVQLMKNKKLAVYVSGGGMIEKGIRSIYIQNQNFGNQIITTNASTKIDGVQWSANTSLGIIYKLDKTIGIYIEPRLSYFFKNEQPISIRTDQPFVIGLTAGFRFEL